MDFAHFDALVRGTLQVDLAGAGVVLKITVRPEGGAWIVEVTGPQGSVRETAPSGIGHAEATAFAARVVDQVRKHAI